jgi:hypothetical protein
MRLAIRVVVTPAILRELPQLLVLTSNISRPEESALREEHGKG